MAIYAADRAWDVLMWHIKYLNRKYHPGQYNCSHLAADVLKHEAGVDISWLVQQASNPFGSSSAIKAASEKLKPCRAEDKALVLMRNARRLWHAGILVGNTHLLHITSDIGYSTCVPCNRLGTMGIEIEGYYKANAPGS